MAFGFQNGFLILLSLTLLSCASTNEVSNRYKEAIGDQATSNTTNLVILIDGLPVRTLKKMIEAGRVPHLRNYFLRNGTAFYRAKPVFPALTYPNLISLITESSVENHGIYGNKVFLGGQFFNFETPTTHRYLNELIQGKNIFSRLSQKGLKSVALGYNFWVDTTASTFPNDLGAAVGILDKEYESVDQKIIQSLEVLLAENPVHKWPDFIFVHLVGLDFTSHDHGPDSAQALDYLEKLDTKLASLFATLERAELRRERHVVALLVADHGFSDPVTKVIDVQSLLPKGRRVEIQNEGRLVSLIYPSYWGDADKTKFYQDAQLSVDVAFKATRIGQEIWIDTPTESHRWPLNLSSVPKWQFPELTESLLRFFRSPEHPGLVFVAKSGVAFTNSYRGFHGGVTEDEMTIPLLLRNGKLKDSTRLPNIYELLNFL